MCQKAKVFLSSTQYLDEFKIERDLLPILFNKEPLKVLFDLWEIEGQAAPIPVHSQFISNIDSSNVFIILIDSIIRTAVIEEYERAKSKLLPIYAFIRQNDARSSEANDFIERIRINGSTTCNYSDFKDLVGKLEGSLLGYYHSIVTGVVTNSKEKERYNVEDRTLKIALGMLNRKSIVLSKDKILKILISEKLRDKELTKDEIKKNLSEFDQNKIDIVLDEMHEAHDILATPGNKYKLREDLSNDFQNEEIEVELYEKTAIEIVYSTYSLVSKYSFEVFSKIVKDAISLIIYQTTISAKNTEIEYGTLPYNSDTIKKIILDVAHQVMPSDEQLWFDILEYILMSDRPEIIYWLNTTRKSYWFLAIMGLDPELAKLYKDNLHEYKIFLDSHIVIRGIVKAGSEAQICEEIIQKGKENNIKMLLSKPIFDEIEISFQNAVKMYRNCDGDIARMSSLLDSLARRSDILDGYLLAKSKDDELEWEEYISRFYSKRDDTILSKYISNELGIDIISDCEYCEEEWGEIQELYSDLVDKRYGTFKKRKEKIGDDKGEDIRQMNLRTNEAKQLEIIYRYKQNGENDYWFVTYDSFIYRVCRDIYINNSSKPKYYPCYLKPNKWLEILDVSSKNGIVLNTFREILMSPSLHIAVNTIEGKVVNEILEKNLDQKIKDKKVLRNMFKDAVNRTIIEDIENDITRKGMEEQNEDKQMEDFIKRVLSDKMKKYEEILSSQDKELMKAKRDKVKALHKAEYFKKELTKVIKGRKTKK